MNIHKLKLLVLLSFVVISLPQTAAASGALLLSSTTALFTIDFTFTNAPFDQTVPIGAAFGVQYNDYDVDVVGYTVESENPDTATAIVMNALVLSRNPIIGTRYSVPSGTEANFSLIILATFAEPITDELRARITKLPYFIEDRRTTVHQNQLNDFHKPMLALD